MSILRTVSGFDDGTRRPRRSLRTARTLGERRITPSGSERAFSYTRSRSSGAKSMNLNGCIRWGVVGAAVAAWDVISGNQRNTSRL